MTDLYKIKIQPGEIETYYESLKAAEKEARKLNKQYCDTTLKIYVVDAKDK